MSLDPTTSEFDFKNPQNQGAEKEEDFLLENATQELEKQLANPIEKISENQTTEKPDVTLDDLNVIAETFPKEDNSSTDDIQKNEDHLQEVDKKMDTAINEIKNIFPEFKNIIIQLESVGFKTNGIYTEKLTILADKCNLTIKKLVNLGKNENLFINQIGILAIIEKTSRSLVKTNDLQMVDSSGSTETPETTEEMGMKILANMDALEKAVQNL